MDASTLLAIVVLIAFGALAGTLASVLGVGGGILVVPFLVLTTNLSQQAAQATALLVVLPTAIVAVWALRGTSVGDPRAAVRMGLVGIPGGFAGALVALHVPGQTLRFAFAALMVLIGVRLLRDGWRIRPAAQ